MTAALAARIEHWMFEDALPFWAARGLDYEAGGYVEGFDRSGEVPIVEEKRLRVVARQIYVFSHAAMLGFSDGERCARHGYDFLRSVWDKSGGAWPRLLSRDGAAIDPTPDLYDHAFVLFALAWFYRAGGEEKTLDLIGETLSIVETRFRSPHGGFLHALPPAGPRQQNPHMHLLEAALALYEMRREDRYAVLARDLIDLFGAAFYRPATDATEGTLTEFFDADLRPAMGEAGRVTEPGHQFEWAWILSEARRLLGIDAGEKARALALFAERCGVDKRTRAVFQSVRNDGAPLDRSSRLWSNTERIKAAVALYEFGGADPRPVIAESAALLFERYLDRTPRGTWEDRLDPEGNPVAGPVPASSFYHLFLAFSEALRIEKAIAGAAAS